MNRPQDCPGSDGFLHQYAVSARPALGTYVTVTILAEQSDLTIPDLLEELPRLWDDMAGRNPIRVSGSTLLRHQPQI